MQGIERTQGQVQHVGSFRLYVTPDGKLVMPMGNSRVTVSQVEAKAMLDNLFILATQFANHVTPASNGSIPVSR